MQVIATDAIGMGVFAVTNTVEQLHFRQYTVETVEDRVLLLTYDQMLQLGLVPFDTKCESSPYNIIARERMSGGKERVSMKSCIVNIGRC